MLKYLESKSSTLTENTFSDKFTGKRVLLLGAGPSTDDVNWENLEYDCVVTSTHFYLISSITLKELSLI